MQGSIAVEVYVLFWKFIKMTINVWIAAQNNQHRISQRCNVCTMKHLHCECLYPPNILFHSSRPNAWWFREAPRSKGKEIPVKYMRYDEDFPTPNLWITVFWPERSSMFALASDSVERQCCLKQTESVWLRYIKSFSFNSVFTLLFSFCCMLNHIYILHHGHKLRCKLMPSREFSVFTSKSII